MVCSIGELTGESCRNRVKRKLGEETSASLQLFQIDDLDGDLSHHFSTTQQVCQNITLKENWMIKQNVRVDLPQRGTICWKHRDHFGSKFRIRSSKCMYLCHIESKRKLTVKPVLQTERLLSSAIIKVILPFGASWCTNCMVRLYPSNWEKHSKLLGDICGVCYQEHNDVSRYNKPRIHS